MIHTLTALGGMVVAPHHLAAQAGRDVLREGGNAVEAMVAAAAAIAVVYPHMNAIGGDGFWVIRGPNGVPGGIDASGASARAATRQWYAQQGITQSIPFRGGQAALTVAGTVSGPCCSHCLITRPCVTTASTPPSVACCRSSQAQASAQRAVDIGDTVKRIDGTEVPILTPWLGKPAVAKAAAPKKAAAAKPAAADAATAPARKPRTKKTEAE